MDTAVPKSFHKITYQFKTTPQIRNLETQFNNLRKFSDSFGWTLQTYREYLRIRTELSELCKEAYNENWEDRIKYISDNTKNNKEFWNKIKLLKGKNATHTNYMKDKNGNKFFTDKEKCNLMEQTWNSAGPKPG